MCSAIRNKGLLCSVEENIPPRQRKVLEPKEVPGLKVYPGGQGYPGCLCLPSAPCGGNEHWPEDQET